MCLTIQALFSSLYQMVNYSKEHFPLKSKTAAQLLGFLNRDGAIPQMPMDLKPAVGLQEFPNAFKEFSEKIHSMCECITNFLQVKHHFDL